MTIKSQFEIRLLPMSKLEFKTLNECVYFLEKQRELRAQIDRKKYHMYMKQVLENQDNLDLIQSEAVEIYTKDNIITGVKTKNGAIFGCKAVIVATGTYLKGKVIIGEVSYESGPDGVFPANELSKSLINLGIEIVEQQAEIIGKFSGQKVVITGSLENFKRKEAQDIRILIEIVKLRNAVCHNTLVLIEFTVHLKTAFCPANAGT